MYCLSENNHFKKYKKATKASTAFPSHRQNKTLKIQSWDENVNFIGHDSLNGGTR